MPSRLVMLLPVSVERSKPTLATPVKEQAVVLFLGEMHYIESIDGRKITVAHPLVPSKCPSAVLGSIALDKSHGQGLENRSR